MKNTSAFAQRTSQPSLVTFSNTQDEAGSVTAQNYAQLVKAGTGKPGFGTAKLKDWSMAIVLTIFFPIGIFYVIFRCIYCKYKGKPIVIFWPFMRSTFNSGGAPKTIPPVQEDAHHKSRPAPPHPPVKVPSAEKKGANAGDKKPKSANKSYPSDNLTPVTKTPNQDSGRKSYPAPRHRPVTKKTPDETKVETDHTVPTPLPPMPSPDEIETACKNLYKSLPTGGSGCKMFARPAKPFESEAAKSALRVFSRHGVWIPRSVTGVPGLRNWGMEFLENILGSDDPEMRELGYAFLRNCRNEIEFLIKNGYGLKFAESLPDGPQKNELREFILETPGLLKRMFASDIELAKHLFTALNTLLAAVKNNNFDDFLYAVGFATNDFVTNFFVNTDSDELRQCFEDMLRNPQARRKFCELLSTNLHPSRTKRVCVQSIFLHWGSGAFEDFCREDPEAFMKCVIFSPNPVVRKEGVELAIQMGLDVSACVRKNGPLFVKQVLAMGEPFISDGYRFLIEHNLASILCVEPAGNAFIELVLKSQDEDIATSGISFIVQNGLFQALVGKYGKEIVQLALAPMHSPRCKALICVLLQEDEVSQILRAQYSDFFVEFANEILPKDIKRSNCFALISFANIFKEPGIAGQAKVKLQKFPPILLAKVPTSPVVPKKILKFTGESRPLDLHFYQWKMFGECLLQNVKSPFFQLRQDIRSLSSCTDTKNGMANYCKEGNTPAEMLTLCKQHLRAVESKYFADEDFDFVEFVRGILLSPSPETRKAGYEWLKTKFPDPAALKATFTKALPTLCKIALTAASMFDNQKNTSMTCAIQAEHVTRFGDILKFFMENKILDDILSAPVLGNIPFALILAVSTNVEQREIGFSHIEKSGINFADPEIFQFLCCTPFNSCNYEMYNAWVTFLKKQGFEYLEIDDKIYELQLQLIP